MMYAQSFPTHWANVGGQHWILSDQMDQLDVILVTQDWNDGFPFGAQTFLEVTLASFFQQKTCDMICFKIERVIIAQIHIDDGENERFFLFFPQIKQ